MMSTPPRHMQAIIIRVYGGVEVLQYEEVAVPSIKPDEILVQVHSAGVSPLDIHVRDGWYKDSPNYSLLMASRILTAFAHGTFFGVGSIVATNLVAPNKRASAIAIMFTGLTVANIIIGVIGFSSQVIKNYNSTH
jgi:hypothetical protein